MNEVQAACRVRGMRSLGVTEERLREQLSQVTTANGNKDGGHFKELAPFYLVTELLFIKELPKDV